MPAGEQVLAGLVALSLLKKATVYGIARYYGFPRLYRRFLHLHMKFDPSPAQHAGFREITKRVMRLPNRFGDTFRQFTQQQANTSVPNRKKVRPSPHVASKKA